MNVGEQGVLKKLLEKKKLDIAMFGHKRIPSREGGIEVVVEELSVRMVRKGHKVVCYNRRGHHIAGADFDGHKKKEYKGVKLVNVFTMNRKGLAAMSASVFGAIRASFSLADVVHIHAEGPAVMAWLPTLMRKKVVVTIHGLDWARAKWGKFASWYIKTGEKNAVRFADEIIVLSKEIQEYFFGTYGKKTVFISNGVNRPNIVAAKEITDKWEIKKDSYILFLGRLVPEKGIHYLLQAFKNIKTDKKLVITGGASDTEDYMNRLRAMGVENVIFTGFQQGRILEELYSNAYVYCLPSDLEGMPLSLLEAMSYGNCCLVSNIAECAEVVEDKALMFEKGNVTDLAKKLQLLCDDGELVNEFKKTAQDFIYDKYNWDDVTNRTIELYRGE